MEHLAADLLPYLTTIIGFLIVYVLNGIKAEIKDVKITVKGLEKDFSEVINRLEYRVTVLETGCTFMHQKEKE